jgi:hypothetical protein
MTVKIAMLKSGEDVIADVKEVVFKDPETQQENHCCMFLKNHTL